VLDSLGGTGTAPVPAGDFILARREVSPADLIELAEVGLVGAVSVAGGASSHAAIIARGLGVPMIAGIDSVVLAGPAGQSVLLDADAGELIIWPSTGELSAASARAGRGASATDGSAASATDVSAASAADGADQLKYRPDRPATTADGCDIAVLCNVASAAETRRGLAAGAGGVGLVRTEIPYTGALAWPTPGEHRAQLAPILGLLAGRTATVRLLDFSGDKIPPFLRNARSASTADSAPTGLAALLAHPTALRDQLDAILDVGRHTDLAVLVPMIKSLAEVRQVRDALSQAAARAGVAPPPLGIMVELQATAADAGAFAPEVDFFSIGTNDLTGQVLGLDRLDPAATPSLAADPRVLALISRVARAGRRGGVSVSVCGDSAADPLVLPLLIGVGIRTLSVPAAQVHQVRSDLAKLDGSACAALATRALAASSAEQVWKMVLAR
jgi:phosphoenolpyruvate-protein kinase (PTS system EI component)